MEGQCRFSFVANHYPIIPVVLPARGEAPVRWNNRLYVCFLVLTRFCFYSVLLVVVDLEASDTYFLG